MKISTGLLFASGVALLSMTGCVDQEKSLFDPEAVRAEYDNAFPVSDIDPDMDWKTTTSVSLTVAVEEDAGVDYTVRVYTDNPLQENSSAKLLAEGIARKGQPVTRTIDVPKTNSIIYVTRTDSHNRHSMKLVSVAENVSVTFGEVAAAQTRAAGFSLRTSTRADEAVTVPTLSPAKSEAEVKALLGSATELTASVEPVGGGVYYIPEGKTVGTGESWMGRSDARVTIIVAGTCTSTKKIEDNVDIYVIGGGKYEIPSGQTLEFTNSSTLTLYAGGKLSGGNITFSNGGVCYLAGDVAVDTFEITNGEVYNYGTLAIDYASFVPATLVNHGNLSIAKTANNIIVYNDGTFDGTTFEGVLYNVNGKSTIENFYNYNNVVVNYDEFYATKTFHGSITNNGKATIEGVNTNNGNTIINNCNLTCYGDFGGDIYGHSNSITTITGDFKKVYQSSINLEANAMVDIQGTSQWDGDGIVGPSAGYGLIRTAHLTSASYINYNSGLKGNIYFEIESCDITGSNLTDYHAWLLNGNGTISKKGESPILISDCTGATNNPVSEGTTDLSDDPLNFTFVFEDNFPDAGDYDFNDAVIDVENTPNYNGNTLTGTDLKITLRAVGAINNIGAAIRLKGFTKSDISSISFDDPSGVRNTLSNAESQFKNAAMEDDNTPVIPLFGNAHAALGVSHIQVNTGYEGNEAAVKSFTIHITSSKKISNDNLDLFITNGKSVGKKRVEVHLFDFRNDGPTESGDICKDNLDVAGNKTWALQIPDFDYPKESVPIKNAYPYFINWASARNMDQVEETEKYVNWYKNPASSSFIYVK